ncbi:uncharacterized protein KZ484_003860 [Pholidichthys leucotaenia]
MKEEEFEESISQEEEQLIVKLEADSFIVTPICEEREPSEAEPIREQLLYHYSAAAENQDEEGSPCGDWGSTDSEEPRTKKRRLKTRVHHEDCPQQHDLESLVIQERNSSLDQEEEDAAQMKEEEACSSQEEGHFGLKQDFDTFIVPLTDEDSDSSETEPNNEQLLFFNSVETLRNYEEAGKNVNPGSSKHEELKKRLHSRDEDNTFMTENQCNTTDTGEESVKCDADDQTSQNMMDHRIHMVVKPHVCNICGKCFTTSYFTKHMRTHNCEKLYSCETCGKCFTLSRSLTDHMRIHTGEKPFSCEICGKSFTQRSSFSLHTRVHTGEKPYCCELCGKYFSRCHHFTEHMRGHSGEKPYFCETCGKGFTRLLHLTEHMRSHTGEKPYFCETCEKRFTRKSGLTKHMRTHTGEKPHYCETCGKLFTQRSNLISHMRIHTGEKPYFCEICGKHFSWRLSLTKHMMCHR